MSITESLNSIRDFRREAGRRYPLVPMYLIVIASIVCGYTRYREIARFAQANAEAFQGFFCLKRKRMPSHVTFRELIQRSDFEAINRAFSQWAKGYVDIEQGDLLAIDGKAIASTVTNRHDSYQDFVSLVSIFAQKRGQVIGVSKMQNRQCSEISVVEELIRMFDLEGVVFSMDALHCKKNHPGHRGRKQSVSHKSKGQSAQVARSDQRGSRNDKSAGYV